jgi:tol-pal system protein YbgF
MRKQILVVSVAGALALLGACSTTEEQSPAKVEERQPPRAQTQPDKPRVATVDVTKPRAADPLSPLKDPKNILSRRQVFFDYDKFDVKDEYRPLVEAHARYLRDNPSARMLIQGNADERGSRGVQRGPGPAPFRQREEDDDAARCAREPDRVREPRRGEADMHREQRELLGEEPSRRAALRGRVLSRLRTALACGAAAWSLAAPALGQSFFDDNEARRRIEVLRQQVEASSQAIDQRLAKVEAAATAAADRSAILEVASQMEALRAEIAKMRGQVEVIANQADVAERRQKDLYLDIDTRLRKLEQAREQQAAAEQKPAAPGQADVSPAETRAYQAALDQFKLGNYPLAVSAMQGFLVTYPQSRLAPNAQYWVGMAYSGQRDYKNAIAAQRQLLAAWPDDPKAPDALLSIASSQETMGDRRSAQRTLEELIAKYPQSSAAASAKQRIAATPKR